MTKTLYNGADLAGATMPGADFSNAQAENMNLTGANSSGGVIAGTDMFGDNLTNANLDGAHGTPSLITNITWSNTIPTYYPSGPNCSRG